jgi:hypothetical protein
MVCLILPAEYDFSRNVLELRQGSDKFIQGYPIFINRLYNEGAVNMLVIPAMFPPTFRISYLYSRPFFIGFIAY